MTLIELLPQLQSFSRILVTGCQRSGTTIAGQMIAKEIGKTYIDEGIFDADALFRYAQSLVKENVVIQCPAMSHIVHLIQDKNTAIVFMIRDGSDIRKSMERIEWEEKQEKEKYFIDSDEPIERIKIRIWNTYQKQRLGDRAFELDYESLSTHPMWVDKEQRKNFTFKQTKIMSNSTIPSDAPISEEEKQKLKDDNIKRKLALPVVKLSVGCGVHWRIPFDEWINLDGLENAHTDIVAEIGSIPLPDASIDLMELGDICEHIPQYRVDEVWNEWTRLLKVGSKIHLGTPNFHRAMTEYTLHTLFGERVPSGWMDIKATDQNGKQHEVRYHIMAQDPSMTPHESARRKIYAWGISQYESHFITYTMETLTELLTRHGFVDIDFSDSPPQELNDPKNSWWFVVTATYNGKTL